MIGSVKGDNPETNKSPGVRDRGGKEASMNTLKKLHGVWYANGKPFKDLHEAVKALRR